MEPLELVVFLSEGVACFALPEHGALVIGRAPECDLRVEDASISRRHAVLHVGPTLQIEDLGSVNGTHVYRAGERSATPDTAPLQRLPGQTFSISIGDRLVLGAVSAVIRRSNVDTRAPEFEVLREQARRAARSDISVLILGETGAGKEVLARYIHEASPRAAGSFVALHCAALSDSLLEAELFGHEKGAFTGATTARPGLFEAAHGGTVLLDEIGEIPASTQVKLLRVLEERAVMRLGARRPTPVDVRFLAATHRNLEAEVGRGAFREDLFYRIAGLTLTVPSLRERRAEIATLGRVFLEEASRRMGRAAPPTLSPAALEAMLGHDWPGNVRELKNAMERAAVLADGPVVLLEHLPPRVVAKGARKTNPPVANLRVDASLTTLDQINTAKKALERQCVEETLEACGGNQTRAAMQLGISRRALVTKIEAYGLKRPRKHD